jgi:hypothetical protein
MVLYFDNLNREEMQGMMRVRKEYVEVKEAITKVKSSK